jgi:DNA ligase-1
MLAVDADMSKVKYPVMVFPKIDGVRGLIRDGQLLGRSLKQHKNLFNSAMFGNSTLDGLDGELAIVRQSKSASLCRDTTSAINRIKGEPELTLHCFDYLTDDTVNLPYLERYNIMWRLVDARPCHVQVIPFLMCQNEEAVMKLYTQYIEEGYEGVVLRDPEAIHKNGRSTKSQAGYLRIKPCGDAEGIVVRLDEAQTNNNEQTLNELGRHVRSSHKANKVGSGKIGALWLTPIKGGEEFKVGAGCMSHEDREYYFNNPSEINGRIVKFKYFDHGAKDAYRHARFFCFRAESDIGVE